MEPTNKLDASLTVDGRYRLLVEAVTDYAIYMLDPNGIVISWNPGAQRFKGYLADEIIGQHFSRFYTEEDRKAGLPARALETARREGQVRKRRLARPQGRHPVLGACRHRSDPSPSGRARRLCQNHARPDRAQASRADAQAQRRAIPAAGAGRHRLRHLHARPRRQCLQLESRRAADQGLRAGGNHRPAFLAFLYRRGSRRRRAAPRAGDRKTRRKIREGRLAGPQGRHAVLGACRYRSAA